MSAAKGDRPQYVTKSAVKEFFKKHNKRVAADTLDQLNEEIEHLLTKAAHRCEQNKRSTIQPQDL
jgi:histone H3/H4